MDHACMSCAIVSGSLVTPGGIVFDHPKWIVALRPKPVRVPCLPMIILRRHCEQVASLDGEESSSLGQVMSLTAQALDQMLHPAKVHFGIYSESVKHLHVHVLPRMPDMPAGNLPNILIGSWIEFLQRLGWKKPYPDEVVAGYADKLREVYLGLWHCF